MWKRLSVVGTRIINIVAFVVKVKNMLVSYLLLTLVAAAAAGPSKVVRPCAFNHHKCIGENLSLNSRCNRRVRGSIPSEYEIKEFKFDTPYFNSTYIDHNLKIRNHNGCVVSEFFFNTDTDTSVLALDCRNINFESDRTLNQHLSLREDHIFKYHINGTYPLVRLTVNLKHAERLDICSAFVFADVQALPIFHVDPKDKPTANSLTTDLTLLNIYEIETFFWRGKQLFQHFVNSMICDFGCE